MISTAQLLKMDNKFCNFIRNNFSIKPHGEFSQELTCEPINASHKIIIMLYIEDNGKTERYIDYKIHVPYTHTSEWYIISLFRFSNGIYKLNSCLLYTK